jgi:hypothetical protein
MGIGRGSGNKTSTVRILSCISRFDGPPERLVIDFRDGEYLNLGDGSDVALGRAKENILKVIPYAEDEAKQTGEVIAAAGVKDTVGKQALNELVEEGELQRKVGQGKGSPWQYWKAQPTSSEEPA